MRVLVWLETEDDGSEHVRLRRLLKGALRAYRFRAGPVLPAESLEAEVVRLQGIIEGLCRRIGGQAEVIARMAEKEVAE